MQKNKMMMIVGGILVVIVVAFLAMQFMGGKKDSTSTDQTGSEEQTEAAVPTVDSSVKVEVVGVNNNKEIEITVSNFPKGTSSIDYQLSYTSVERGLQGLIGTLEVENGKNSVSKKVTVGTCSSGTCVYDKIEENKVTASLSFNGSYGMKAFEKEYEL